MKYNFGFLPVVDKNSPKSFVDFREEARITYKVKSKFRLEHVRNSLLKVRGVADGKDGLELVCYRDVVSEGHGKPVERDMDVIIPTANVEEYTRL